jgi:hypothetical protein
MCDFVVYEWERAIFVLSLDKTLEFVHELGIENFYSNDVRDAAREIVRGIMDGDDVCESSAVNDFLRKLRDRGGEATVEEFRRWQSEVVYGFEEYNIFWSWMIVLSRLCRLWDNAGYKHELPLSSPSETHHRISVRVYLRHLEDIRLESAFVERADCSLWDDDMVLRSGEYGCWETLLEICHSRYSKEFWTQFISELPSDAIDDLLGWARALAQIEDLPVEHLSLPISHTWTAAPVPAA